MADRLGLQSQLASALSQNFTKFVGGLSNISGGRTGRLPAPSINQIWVIEHAYQRQNYICQSQSVNLFFIPPPATADQEVHDEYLEYINSVHWAGANKLKSMYYLRSNAARNTENVNIKIPRINLEEGECLSCEG